MSSLVNKYIIFSYIKEFVLELEKFYTSESLFNYRNFMDNVDLLNESDISDFVDGFKKCIGGTKPAFYCEGAYINIPKLLKKRNENTKVINDYLAFFAKVYENPGECKELKFLESNTDKYKNDTTLKQQIVNVNVMVKGKPDIGLIKDALTLIKPHIENVVANARESKLNADRLLRIILLIIYEKIMEKKDVAVYGKGDIDHVVNILQILINTPLNGISKVIPKLITEFHSMEVSKEIGVKPKDILSLSSFMKL